MVYLPGVVRRSMKLKISSWPVKRENEPTLAVMRNRSTRSLNRLYGTPLTAGWCTSYRSLCGGYKSFRPQEYRQSSRAAMQGHEFKYSEPQFESLPVDWRPPSTSEHCEPQRGMSQDFSNKSIPGLLPTNQFQNKTVVNLERNEPLNFTNSHTRSKQTQKHSMKTSAASFGQTFSYETS